MEEVKAQKLTTDEIVIMCKRLANKYHMYHMKDDLVSEGVLAIYERLAVNPDEYPAKLYNIAKGAIYAYVNIKSRALAIPVNRTTMAVALGKIYNEGEEWRKSTYSDGGIDTIYDALQGASEYNYLHAQTEDCSEDYEVKDTLDKAFMLLSEKESEVIRLRYLEEKSQEEVADIYGVSHQSISLWEREALIKMSKL
tara:strand:+ start:164 stop:751 length:588 start_codon:yes stop_codon:yes gene_type:complete